MKVHQVELAKYLDKTTAPPGGGIIAMVVWVDAARGIKKGSRVTGKDGEQWFVTEVYSATVDTVEIHDDWKVGGLM